MPRYIDTSKVTIPKGFFEDLNVPKLLEWLNNQPTADVAPKSDVAREIFEEIESKIKNDIDDITESINHIIDPDAIDGQYEEIATLEWVLDSVAELKMKYTGDQT